MATAAPVRQVPRAQWTSTGRRSGSSMILRISRNCHSSPKPSPGIGRFTKSTPEARGQRSLGVQLVAGHLQVDDGPDAVALDGLGELIAA